MQYSIDRLNAELNARNGLARKNRYNVNILGPAREALSILCTECSIPSMTLTAADTGLIANKYKIAAGYSYDAVTFKFMLPGNSSRSGPKEFFDEWMLKTVMLDKDKYILNYPDDYRQDVQIEQLDLNNKVIYAVKLLRAWPVSIDSMTMSNSSEDIQEISVNMEYHDIEVLL